MRYHPCQAHEARLRCPVCRLPEIAVEPGARHDIYDGAGNAAGFRLLAQHRSGGSEQPIGASEVGAQHCFPSGRIRLEDEGIANDRGVVDHDVDAAEALLRQADGLLCGCGFRDIATERRCPLHARRDLLGDLRVKRFPGNRHAGIDDDDVRAVGPQVLDDGEADPARAAGDDRNAVFQVHAQIWLYKASAWIWRGARPRVPSSAVAASTITGGPARYAMRFSVLIKSASTASCTRPWRRPPSPSCSDSTT